MSRWTPNKPLEQVMQVREPFSRKGGHRVGNGKAAGKSLTQADIRARVRRAVWTVAVCSAATVGSFLYALARLGAL